MFGHVRLNLHRGLSAAANLSVAAFLTDAVDAIKDAKSEDPSVCVKARRDKWVGVLIHIQRLTSDFGHHLFVWQFCCSTVVFS